MGSDEGAERGGTEDGGRGQGVSDFAGGGASERWLPLQGLDEWMGQGADVVAFEATDGKYKLCIIDPLKAVCTYALNTL